MPSLPLLKYPAQQRQPPALAATSWAVLGIHQLSAPLSVTRARSRLARSILERRASRVVGIYRSLDAPQSVGTQTIGGYLVGIGLEPSPRIGPLLCPLFGSHLGVEAGIRLAL